MRSVTGDQSPASSARSRPRSDGDRLRHLLIAGWLAVLVGTLLAGERATSWSEVRALVASGEVGEVRVSPELPAGATGYTVVDVSWRQGLVRHSTQVVQVSGPGQRAQAEVAAEQVAGLVGAAPSDILTELQPGLRVTRDQGRPSGGEIAGWQVPTAIALSALLVVLLSAGLVVSGPDPWRATRWAWFWLLMNPVSLGAFLLLSGPTPGLPAPRDGGRRLTGGWAFLLSMPLAALLHPAGW